MVEETTLYKTITEIAEDYFGPAAPRFMNRLITNHLGKQPEQLTRRDITALARWAKVTAAMITDDQKSVDEFVRRLKMASQN